MATRRCISSNLEDDEDDFHARDNHSDDEPLVFARPNPALLQVTRRRMFISALLDIVCTGCCVAAATYAWLSIHYEDPVGAYSWEFYVTSDIRSCSANTGVCESVAITDLNHVEWEDVGNLSMVTQAVYVLTVACGTMAAGGILATLLSIFLITKELDGDATFNADAHEERYWMRRSLYPPIRHAVVLLVGAGAVASYAMISSMFVRDNQLDFDATLNFYIGFWVLVGATCMQAIALMVWLLPCS